MLQTTASGTTVLLEDLHRLIVESAHEGVWVIDADGRTVFVNRRLTELLGTTAAAMQGRSPIEVVREDARERAIQSLARRRAGISESIELPFLCGDGSTVWLLVSANSMFAPDGSYDGAVAMVADVSETHRIREDLQESKRIFENAQSVAHVGSFVSAPDAGVFSWSAETYRILGYEPGVTVSREAFLARVHPDDRERVSACSLSAYQGRGDYDVEYRIVRPDGVVRWLRNRAELVPAEGGRPARLIGTCQDVTEQVEGAAKLRASEERFRALVDNGSDGSALLAADGTILYGSPAAERILGRAIKGLNAMDFAHPEDRAALERIWAKVLASPGVPIRQTLRLRRADETWRSVEVIRTNRLDEPALHAIVSNFRDVTEREELEAQFRQAQKMEAIGRLAGGVAHDFNNLIAVILSYASMASEDLPDGNPVRGDLAEIKRASERAATLTRQLLAFSRRQLLQPRVVDLNAAVAEAEKMLRRMVPESVTARFLYDPETRRALLDPAAFEQCLMNLVVNARDAMPDGGELEISVSARTLDADGAREHGVAEGPCVTVSVRDTGVGMDDAVRARLFEPFFTTKDRGKGTGLGLSTVFGIVKQSGGGIEVRSAPGAGSTFILYFPQSIDDVDEITPPYGIILPAVPGTVLLVEDEPSVREAARRILVRSGFRVLDSASAGEAMVIAEKHADIDVLVTDVVMPWMSGPELAMRLHATRPGLKVLFISGYPDPVADPEGVLRESKVLAKPFTPDGLVRRVREVLSGGS